MSDLDEAVAALRQDPSKPVRAKLGDITVELRAVNDGHTEQSAADAFAAVGPWEGETPDELRKRLSRARFLAPPSGGYEDPLAWEGDGWDGIGPRRKS